MGVSSHDGEGTWNIATSFHNLKWLEMPNQAIFVFLGMEQNIKNNFHIGIETLYVI